jgi:GNAT superfamily N-acetyltransferase
VSKQVGDNTLNISIDQMRQDEVQTLAQWACSEGWNPGRADIDLAWAFDPHAFIAMRRGDELVAGGTILSYGGQFGFMGLFIVRADLRGQGLGTQLWHHRRDRLLARLQPGAAIGMDGVFDMVPFYTQGGFQLAWRDLRFEGTARGLQDARAVDLQSIPFAQIDQFDRHYFGVSRAMFLQAWMHQPGSHALGLIEAGELVAYGVVRPAQAGFKIGPAFARRDDLAERLLGALLAKVEGHTVQLDVPECNEPGLELASRLGLTESFGCARMYHGVAPQIEVSGVFGVTSFEFG